MNNNFQIAKEIIQTKGILSGVTSGKSMCPLFRSGKDTAVVAKLPQKLKVNDVVLYRKKSTDELILHRIIKFKDSKPILRGDNLFHNETNVSQDDIIGIMQSFYRNGKHYSCSCFKYKLYVYALRASYPLRRALRKIKSIIRKKNAS